MVGNKVRGWLALTLLLAPAAAGAQDDTVLRAITPERLEKFLKEQKVEYQRSSVPKEDVHVFTFQRGKFEVHLTSFGARDLMLDCSFKPLNLEAINRWNIDAKFSRASLQKGAKGEPISVLEYNLDLSGGITADALKSFLTRFDEEMKNYDLYLAGPPDTKILMTLPDETLEKILAKLSVKFEKKASGGGTVFEFEVDGQPVRLQNYGGKDLRLAARYAGMSLEDVNEYNLNRKFVRAVNYKKDGKDITVLETTMDCEPGVTEGMIRHFILAFGEDVRHFADYAKKAGK